MRAAALTLVLCFCSTMSAAETVVVYPRPESQTDARTLYPVKLLQQALNLSGTKYTLRPSEQEMLQGRALLQLEDAHDISVLWTMTTPEREKTLLPVRIPIDKGLLGIRLLLVKKERLVEFKNLDAKKLAEKTAIQGHDWPDTDILHANQFKVVTVAGYDSMFRLLENGSVDYFPRSISEIWDEAKSRKAQGLVIEQGLALRYQAARYFFVNKNNTKLAADISKGLEKMLADGSFEKLFQETFGAYIARAKLASRHVIELHNPNIPAEAPLSRKE